MLGGVLLSDLTEDKIRDYIRRRQHEGVCGRSINLELGEPPRAIGRTWKELWPKVRKLEERKDIGQALTSEQQHALLDAVEQSVGRAKTASGTGRILPINDDLFTVLYAHRQWFVEHFWQPLRDHYLLPWGSPVPADPERHAREVKTAWTKARQRAKVLCRLHDLRHTYATSLAEAGVPESTMLALMGHMSRAMLERYSHIRMKAKREAVAGIRLRPQMENSKVVPVVAENRPIQ